MTTGTLLSFPSIDLLESLCLVISVDESTLEQDSERINPSREKLKQFPNPKSFDDSVLPESNLLPEVIFWPNEFPQSVKDITVDDSAISDAKLGHQNVPLDAIENSNSEGYKQSVSKKHGFEANFAELSDPRENEETRAKGENSVESSSNDVAAIANKEESLIASSSLPESIAYSGVIGYTGSLSLRSDSTTSARSFAFPILQNEWNSSPVRMAKAEGMSRRMLRRWRDNLLCCKF